MTIPEITGAIQSIKTVINIIRGFNELKTEYEVKSATSELLNSIIDVQNNLLSIQSSYQTLLEAKNEIEKELITLKDWESTKLNYTIKQISLGSFVYILKDPQNSPDNQYWLCANCFDILQKESKYLIRKKGNIQNHVYYCPSCRNEILIKNSDYKPLKPLSSKRGFGNNPITNF